MKMTFATLSLAMASAALLTVAGCGGGSTAPTVTPVTPSAITISGIAASGAAFVDAVVTVIDSTGAVVGTSGTVGTDGTYSVTVAAGAKAPFVLVASRTTADGEVQSLVSVIDSASTTTANVTPITNLIASLLSPSGDPGKLAEELAAGTASITPDSVAATVTEVKTILATLLDATGTTGTDPLTGSFTVDGTGYDRLLDSISINIVPASSTSSNIEIAVRQELADGEQPASISFTSDASAIDPLPTIDSATLVEEGTSVKIANLLAELTACYALPVTERVNGAADQDEPNMYVGTSVNVVAPACKAVFFGNDPAIFYNNGGRVGRTEDNRGAFASLFRGGATGLVFSQGTYEFTRGNGDLVVGYKTRATDTSETFDTFVVSKDTDGKLRLIGNYYDYPGSAASFHQRRNFITLNQLDWTYYSTGYTLDVTDLKSGGVSLFNRVVVTTPNNSQVVLRPAPGSSFLVISKNDDPASAALPPGAQLTGSNFIRLRSEYADGSTTRPHPRLVETNNIVFAPTDRTEAELASTPSLGSWKFEYYLAADPSASPVVQYRKNRARALNIAELRTQGLATLTSGLITEVQSGAQPLAEIYPGQILFVDGDTAGVETEGGGDGWSVLSGQLPPTSITVFGNFGTSNSFNDSTGVRSTLRKATVPCTSNGIAAQQCLDNGDGTYGPAYAAGTRLTGIQLLARDAVGREYGNFYAMYQLTLPTP